MIYIGKSRQGQRAAYWNDIKKRVTTHEGELLHGDKGKKYQEKYSERYLGKDLSSTKRIDSQDVERYEKTKK